MVSNSIPCACSRRSVTSVRYVAKSSTRSARIWSALASKPPETYPLTVWNQGGELLKASHRLTLSLI